MRFVDPPTLDSPWREQPGDDLDGLLRAFFRAELPSPFPAAPQPEEAEQVVRTLPARRRPLWESRLALAASVALLLVGGWLLSGLSEEAGPTGEKLPRMSAPTADRSADNPRNIQVRPSIQHKPSSQETEFRLDLFLPEMDPLKEK